MESLRSRLLNPEPAPWLGPLQLSPTGRPTFLRRILFGALLGLPLAVSVWYVSNAGFVPVSVAALAAKLDAALASSLLNPDLDASYPPIPVALTALVAASPLALGVLTSFFSGTALFSVWTRLGRLGVAGVFQLPLLVSVVLVPTAWYAATQDLASAGALAMLVIALEGFIRFVVDRDEAGGFTAGLFLAAAFLFDPSALIYAACFVLATPLLVSYGWRESAAAAPAMVLVLGFPTAALAVSWLFLEWSFGGNPSALVASTFHLFSPADVVPLADAVYSVLMDLGRVPLFWAVGLLLVLRRPLSAVGYVVPVVGVVLSRWVGVGFSPVHAVLLLSFLALVSIPKGLSIRVQASLAVVAAFQLAVNIFFPAAAPGFEAWISVF